MPTSLLEHAHNNTANGWRWCKKHTEQWLPAFRFATEHNHNKFLAPMLADPDFLKSAANNISFLQICVFSKRDDIFELLLEHMEKNRNLNSGKQLCRVVQDALHCQRSDLALRLIRHPMVDSTDIVYSNGAFSPSPLVVAVNKGNSDVFLSAWRKAGPFAKRADMVDLLVYTVAAKLPEHWNNAIVAKLLPKANSTRLRKCTPGHLDAQQRCNLEEFIARHEQWALGKYIAADVGAKPPSKSRKM